MFLIFILFQALLKKKDFDLRKLREKLNSEILLKEETQFTLQDKLLELQSKSELCFDNSICKR